MSGGFGNPLVGGGGALVYPAVKSPNFSLASQTGWAILKNGTAYFFNIMASGTITATAVDAGNTIINSTGIFIYSPSVAAGNLIASFTDGGTGPFGEVVLPGLQTFQGASNVLVQGDQILFSGGASISQTAVSPQNLVLGGTPVQVNTPIATALTALEPGTSTTAEVWHNLTVPAGMTGYNRVMLLPDGMVMLDVQLLITSDNAAGTSYTAGPLPSAAYYPIQARQFPMAVNQLISAAVANAPVRAAVPVSPGSVSYLAPAFSVAGNACIFSGSAQWPTN
jgi:hypothetical protein